MIVEWIAFIGMFAVMWVPYDITFVQDVSFLKRLIRHSYRYAFSAFLSVIILLSMSPKKEDSINWARPSCFFRAFLSLGIWLPLATLSYSIYLWHFFIMLIMATTNKSFAETKKALSNLST